MESKDDLIKQAQAKWEKDQLVQQAQAKWQKQQQAPQPQSEPSTNANQAALSGFANTATAGYLPQLQAAASKPIYGLLNMVTGQDVQPDSYVNERDRNIAQIEAEKSQHPYAYGAGAVGGAIASAPIYSAPLRGLGAATTIGGKAAQGALAGGLQGLIQNPGDSKGIVNPTQLPERVGGGIIGAGTGGALGAAGGAISKALNPAEMETTANKLAYKAIGAQKKDVMAAIRNAPSDELDYNIKEVGKYLKDNKLVQAGDNIDSVAQKLSDHTDKIGQALDNVYSTATNFFKNKAAAGSLSKEAASTLEETNIDPIKIAKDIRSQLKAKYNGKDGGTQAIKMLEDKLADFEANADKNMSLKDLWNFRREVDTNIPFGQEGYKIKTSMLKDYRRLLKDQIDKRVDGFDKLTGGALGSELKDLNKQYGISIGASNIANKRMAAEQANNMMSLTDKMFGASAAGAAAGEAAHGNISGAIKTGMIAPAMMGVSKYTRQYATPAMMGAAQTMSNVANTAPIKQISSAARGLLPQTAVTTQTLQRSGLLGKRSGLQGQ